MVYAGIDPGLKGAVAICLGENQWQIHKMPLVEEPEELIALVKSMSGYKVYIERPILKPVMGFKKCPRCKGNVPVTYMQKGVSTSQQGYGILIGLLMAFGIAYEEIEGTRWKKYFLLEKKGKSGSIVKAKAIFPSLIDVIGRNDGIADAILIAEYGNRQRRNDAT